MRTEAQIARSKWTKLVNTINPPRRWFIRIERGYKVYSAWPLLFRSREEAEDYMALCFTFKGLGAGKMSASVEGVQIR